MKVLYIGSGDQFAVELFNRLAKEGHTVGLVATLDFMPTVRPALAYHWFGYPADTVRLDKVFASYKPEQVVFAGRQFGDAVWIADQEVIPYSGELVNILNLAGKHRVNRFIYLSTTEVYPPKAFDSNSVLMTESGAVEPATLKGILCAQGERLAQDFCRRHTIDLTILRFSDLCGYVYAPHRHDLISSIQHQLQTLPQITVNSLQIHHPLAIGDAVDALVRALGASRSALYNVAGSQSISSVELYARIKALANSSADLISEPAELAYYPVDSSAVKRELEWVEFHHLDEKLPQWVQQATVPAIPVIRRRLTLRTMPLWSQLLQTIVLFAVLAGLSWLVRDHSILSKVDLMTVYVLVVSLFFGVQQGVLAVLLAFGYYLFAAKGLNNTVLSVVLNPDTFLRLAYLIFAGIVVGYAVDQYQKATELAKSERDYLQNEYAELKTINDDNVLIKQQYEKRLISYRTSLPRLYEMTRQLDSLDHQVLYSSLVNLIHDVMDVETVAVYAFAERSGYTRLIGARNDRSLFQGKSFKLSNYPALEARLRDNDVYIGDQWSEDSPAMAGAIYYQGQIIALIIIRELPFELMSLYQVNLMRTLTALISSSFIRAFQYEEKTRAERFLENSEVLNAPEFVKLLRLSQADKDKQQADYTVLQLTGDLAPVELYHQVAGYFRTSDIFGVDTQNQLYVLLKNTGEADLPVVKARLESRNVQFRPCLFDLNNPETLIPVSR